MRSLIFRTCFTALLGMFLLCIAEESHAQVTGLEKSDSTIVEGGNKFYIHHVEKGQTLYSISKVYGVMISEIVFENPIVLDGIQPDQYLKIPFESKKPEKKEKPNTLEIDEGHLIHIVEKGQTLYSISKKYAVSVEQIQNANPGRTDTLGLGQMLRIPVEPLIDKTDTTPVDMTGLMEEPDTIVPTVPRDTIIGLGLFTDTTEHKEHYKVAMLLPFYLDDNDTLVLNRRPNEPEQIFRGSINALRFYEGALLALDTMEKMGIHATIHVFDTDGSEIEVRQILNKHGFKNSDLVIGPFFSKNFRIVADYAKKQPAPVVTPMMRNTEMLQGQPEVCKVYPSEKSMVEGMAEFVADSFCIENTVVVHNGEEPELVKSFMTAYMKKCDTMRHPAVFNATLENLSGLDTLLSPVDSNAVVVLSHEQLFVSKFILKTRKLNDDYNISVFGLESWRDIETIEVEYLQELKVHIPSHTYVDYEKPAVKWFVKKFRDHYHSEPGMFAFQGFDVTYFYLMALHLQGTRFYHQLHQLPVELLHTGFDFERISPLNGYENKKTFIFKYEDYELKRVR